ncbi:AfsR/SARP family transcriptional regulator [Actinokineospora inagensis]|uniref:AfsR/SARP family transcriptional regulator n=1 Tax=Actinokineospora inagensis TaxID=103730 RepID=UPI00068691FC|nr:AfsR/SARP family transcriptional regulator [Actinokineospora inagensis]
MPSVSGAVAESSAAVDQDAALEQDDLDDLADAAASARQPPVAAGVPRPAVRLGLLGPLTAVADGRDARPGAGKQRQVLALLAVHRNRVVPVDSIVREVWHDQPPRSALTALQTYIGQIRQAFAERLCLGRKEVACRYLVTEAGGYSLRLDQGGLDLHTFETGVVRARAAIAVGDLAAGRRNLRAALQCWRGNPVEDLKTGPLLSRWAEGVADLRLSMQERWIELNMAAGLHRDMHAEITPLCAEHPLHEGFQALLMMILHQCGRSAAALDSFLRFRARIVAELGVQPSGRLSRLYQSILVGDPVPPPLAAAAPVA